MLSSVECDSSLYSNYMNSISDEVISFLHSHVLATLGTFPVGGSSSGSGPHLTSVFYFFENEKLHFASRRKSQKIENLIANPSVSFLITDQEKLLTLQIEGTAQVDEKQDPSLINKLIDLANQQSKDSFPPFMKAGQSQFITVTIDIRYFKLSQYPDSPASYTEGSP